MGKLIAVSIDLTKIDKKRIKDGKNGQKYFDILISVNDKEDKFGQDVSVMQGQSKEEREQKIAKVYLGNGKTIWRSAGETTATPYVPPASEQPKTLDEQYTSEPDDLPF